MNIGGELRRARMTRKLSLSEISRRTKIAPTALRDIENNRFDCLPGGIVTRGFLRAYAREIDLNPEAIVQCYRDEFETRDVLQQSGERNPRSKAFIDSLTLSERMSGIAQTIVLVVVTSIGLVYFGVLHDNAPHDSAPLSTVPAPKPPEAPENTTAAAATLVPTTGSLDTVLEASPGAPLKLEIHTTGECWIAASADGKQVVARLMNAGEQLQFDVRERLTMRVGDPSTLALTINGAVARPLGSAGRAVTVEIDPENYKTFLQTS